MSATASAKEWEFGGSTAGGEVWVYESEAKLLYSGGEDGPPEYEDTRLFCATLQLAEQICREHNAHADLLAACKAVLHWYEVDSSEFNREAAIAGCRAAIANALAIDMGAES